mmetsp:Transcript_65854/g.183476  ORF Transcript_65854/g.183476 Transcript_65854/m.183476 type:complete len:375 (-) Transcript_65854:31-1155(-)
MVAPRAAADNTKPPGRNKPANTPTSKPRTACHDGGPGTTTAAYLGGPRFGIRRNRWSRGWPPRCPRKRRRRRKARPRRGPPSPAARSTLKPKHWRASRNLSAEGSTTSTRVQGGAWRQRKAGNAPVPTPNTNKRRRRRASRPCSWQSGVGAKPATVTSCHDSSATPSGRAVSQASQALPSGHTPACKCRTRPTPLAPTRLLPPHGGSARTSTTVRSARCPQPEAASNSPPPQQGRCSTTAKRQRRRPPTRTEDARNGSSRSTSQASNSDAGQAAPFILTLAARACISSKSVLARIADASGPRCRRSKSGTTTPRWTKRAASSCAAGKPPRRAVRRSASSSSATSRVRRPHSEEPFVGIPSRGRRPRGCIRKWAA